jgi:hypothetical protein
MVQGITASQEYYQEAQKAWDPGYGTTRDMVHSYICFTRSTPRRM